MNEKELAIQEGDAALHEQESTSSESAKEELGHPMEADPTVDDLPVSQQQWFRQLAERWAKNHKVSLQLRYDTGKAINMRIGSPDQRQPRGFSVVDTLAAEIGVDAGEISRMRWFAHRVLTLAEFCREHPNIRSWDAVKSWLAGEARQDRGEDTSSKEETAPVDRFAKSLQAAARVLPAPDAVQDEEEKDLLLLELKRFGRRFKKLGVAITVTEVAEPAESEPERAGSSS